MLGRQQIAGIPTAIHELFKNAHDAYAHLVRVDYVHNLDLLLLRDDGLGMTAEDFETKWLTLGTESKVFENDPGRAVWTGPEDLPRRSSLGEKGIGRLAVAAVGPQVLVYSRAVREDGPSAPILGLVNWSLFEQPGLDLDRIDIPMRELPIGATPTATDIGELLEGARANLTQLEDVISADEVKRIRRELDAFPFDPDALYKRLGASPLDERPYGTHFFVRPTSAELALDLDAGRLLAAADIGVTPLERYLLGFGNTMRGDVSAPPIIAEFWEHRSDNSSEDLIGPRSFFTPDEFQSADHHIEGGFDEFGTFRGKVRIYDEVEHDFVLSPPSSHRGRTVCGPFRFNFAYVQGSAKDTRMPLDEWKRLSDKCERIGGLYIYRDGIRVLPYGNSDYDWLNIERRRTLAAKDWFFSYRRLFGAVEITHRDNAALVEKAGREGFRQNRAYREFATLLEELFKRLAVDFFRENAKFSGDWAQIRANKQREHDLLQKRSKQVSGLKRDFDGAMQRFFEDVRSGRVERRSSELAERLNQGLADVRDNLDPASAGEHLLALEGEIRAGLTALETSLNVPRPRLFGLNKRQKQDFDAYSAERQRLLVTHVAPLLTELENATRELEQSGVAAFEPRLRLEEPVRRESSAALNKVAEARKTAVSSLGDFEMQVRSTLQTSWTDLSRKVEIVKADLAQTEVAGLSSSEIDRRRDRLLGEIRGTSDEALLLMQGLSDQLASMMSGLSDRMLSVDVTAALESENDDLRSQVDQYADLAQAGMALGLVQHEFSGQVRAINRGLNALKTWAGRNPSLNDLYSNLRVSFEHLESYLQLFVPLNRRLQRTRVQIAGKEIEEFLRTIFEPRFERHGIRLVTTSDFELRQVLTYPSSIMPAFVNVVDNAVHWLSTVRDGERIVTLDANADGFLIGNNGPGVDERDAERIFEFGETNKSSGRGMGLYLSRQALRRERMDVRLLKAGVTTHPLFIITYPSSEE